ncbi:MAG: DUF2652 domain-containing protein [Proteobacteria bacterium]|nr:DUF2652 domain-containing protein [Pseudomonadota bacterium]
MEITPTILVFADISGYTRFIRLNKISIIHAEAIVTELLDVVTRQAAFPLKLNKLEGDGAFFYCDIGNADPADAVNDVAGQIDIMMTKFAAKHAELVRKSIGGCICGACRHLEALRLKIFAHLGDTVMKCVNDRVELGGEPPIVVHRLGKNGIAADEYVLVTDEFGRYLDHDVYPSAKPWRETYEEIGTVNCKLFLPNCRDLEQPTVWRLTRLRGIAEAVRLFWIGFSDRFTRGDRRFQNIQASESAAKRS